ncbi:MAG TPA: hypothetical protein VFN44_13760 [Solirubrobacteraceae bacterium]|nr:hypothetical protein [Solirubrobacteraceae bacterium]
MTDVRTELARLELPGGGGYYRSRIPCPEDSEIARAIKAFTESTPREQAAFRAGIDRTRAGLLQVWSERIAALAVRLDSPRPLVLGLVGLSLAQSDDEFEALLIAPLHRRSADKLGVDAPRLFDEAAGLTDLVGARWLAEQRDSDDQPEDTGYVEDDDGEGFRYERDGGSGGLGLR